MKHKFTIPGRFLCLNDWNKLSYHAQNDEKQSNDATVGWCAKSARIPKITRPVRLHILWVEKNRRRDLDNIAFAIKFIQDGLVKVGVLHNDTRREIVGFSHEFAYDSSNPRIEVTIEEV